MDATRSVDGVEAVTCARVVVPLDGSALAETALRPASALSRRFGAELRLLGVGVDEADAKALAWRLDPLAKVLGATYETRVGRSVPATILDVVAERERTLLCLASHGRGRLSGAVLGSVANGVLAGATHPVVLVGPRLEPQRSPTEGPVLACVDGSPASEAVIPVAASWATALGVPLGIATVAEPVPQPLDDRPYRPREPTTSRSPSGWPAARRRSALSSGRQTEKGAGIARRRERWPACISPGRFPNGSLRA